MSKFKELHFSYIGDVAQWLVEDDKEDFWRVPAIDENGRTLGMIEVIYRPVKSQAEYNALVDRLEEERI